MLMFHNLTNLQAVFSFITMQFQLCSVFFTFSLGTRTHYFGRTILHGGAKVSSTWLFGSIGYWYIARHNWSYLMLIIFLQYRATGRGFVVRHIKFADNYRLYSRSHFVKAWVIFVQSIKCSCLKNACCSVVYIHWLSLFALQNGSCIASYRLHCIWVHKRRCCLLCSVNSE